MSSTEAAKAGEDWCGYAWQSRAAAAGGAKAGGGGGGGGGGWGLLVLWRTGTGPCGIAVVSCVLLGWCWHMVMEQKLPRLKRTAAGVTGSPGSIGSCCQACGER